MASTNRKAQLNHLPKQYITSTLSRLSQSGITRNSSCDKPTPLDFDNFLPWICREWEVPSLVAVTRMYQEEYITQENRRSSPLRSKSINFKNTTLKFGEESDSIRTIITKMTETTFETETSEEVPIFPIVAYYNNRNNLVEISIIGHIDKKHLKVIQAINICVPFHSFLYKLTINKGGVTNYSIYEISKLLPHSNLTEVCLDNSSVPEGNYFILLDKTSKIKLLSLNRCNINDLVCKEIAIRISFDGPAYPSLVILQLESNLISDIGCQYVGDALRRNHRLLHLNLAGNKIGDIGAKAILENLKEFQLSKIERSDSWHRKINLLKNKDRILKKCMDEVSQKQKAGELPHAQINRRATSVKRPKSSRKSKKILGQEYANNELNEDLAKEIMGQYEDPFDTGNIFYKNGSCFCPGNMGLCSLNLAFNELTYASVEFLETVMDYQRTVSKPVKCTGLMNVNLDGNFIPKYCSEYESISMMLKKVVNDNIPVTKRRRSVLRK